MRVNLWNSRSRTAGVERRGVRSGKLRRQQGRALRDPLVSRDHRRCTAIVEIKRLRSHLERGIMTSFAIVAAECLIALCPVAVLDSSVPLLAGSLSLALHLGVKLGSQRQTLMALPVIDMLLVEDAIGNRRIHNAVIGLPVPCPGNIATLTLCQRDMPNGWKKSPPCDNAVKLSVQPPSPTSSAPASLPDQPHCILMLPLSQSYAAVASIHAENLIRKNQRFGVGRSPRRARWSRNNARASVSACGVRCASTLRSLAAARSRIWSED